MDALWIIPHKDQHLGHGHRGDAVRLHQLGGSLSHQPVKFSVMRLDFLMQREPAPSDRAHGRLGGGRWGRDFSWPHRRHMAYQSDPPSDSIERITKVGWCIHDQRFQRDHRLGLGVDAPNASLLEA